jgi:hypothetical protein
MAASNLNRTPCQTVIQRKHNVVVKLQLKENVLQNLYPAEIDLIEDSNGGLRIECLFPHVAPLRHALEESNFTVDQPRGVIDATPNIPATVEIAISGGSFEKMEATVHDSLLKAGVNVTKESFSGLGQKHVRLNLDNVSIFGQ